MWTGLPKSLLHLSVTVSATLSTSQYSTHYDVSRQIQSCKCCKGNLGKVHYQSYEPNTHSWQRHACTTHCAFVTAVKGDHVKNMKSCHTYADCIRIVTIIYRTPQTWDNSTTQRYTSPVHYSYFNCTSATFTNKTSLNYFWTNNLLQINLVLQSSFLCTA